MATTYDKNNQVDLQGITLKSPNSKELLDITSILEQFIIYEDMFQTAISARLIFSDQNNIIGTLPIVGGETVNIKFRTPIYDEFINLEFVVYQIGERDIGQDNMQIGQLMLCTPEVWVAANMDVSASYQGTYTDIITKILKETGTKKDFSNKEDSIGTVDYVGPMINHFSAIKFCASRANTETMSPMFFWESLTGYNLKSLKILYRDQYDKFIYIEDRNVVGADSDPDKVFNTAFSFNYPESNNRLDQFTKNAFGVDYMSVDFTNMRIMFTSNSYDKSFNERDIKLNKFPLNDDAKLIRDNGAYTPYTKDMSHLTAFNRNSNLAMMDNLKLYVNIPGDSKLKTGKVVWLEIPSKSGLVMGTEAHSSGKWLVRSIKHLITKTTYSQVCELTKDSFDVNVRTQTT